MLKLQSGHRPSSAPVPPPGASDGSGQCWHSQGEAGPLSAQPLPRVLELAASKAADSTAFDHPGLAKEPIPGATEAKAAEQSLRARRRGPDGGVRGPDAGTTR